MSKLLPKILNAAIFPAALMIVGKILGMILANRIYGLDWGIQTNTGGLFSVEIVYPDLSSAILCNTFSNLVMVLCLSIGTGLLLFQGTYLNTSRQNPKVLVRLMQFDFIMWLTESSIVFPRLFVWIAFLWISTIILIAQSLQGMLYTWVAIASFIISVVCSWIAAQSFEQELITILPEHDKLDTE